MEEQYNQKQPEARKGSLENLISSNWRNALNVVEKTHLLQDIYSNIALFEQLMYEAQPSYTDDASAQ